MQLLIKHDHLIQAVVRVQGALLEKNLSQVALKAEGGMLHVSASDLFLAIYTSTECQIEKEGTVFVPAKIFSDIVKELPKADIELHATKTFLLIKARSTSSFIMKVPLLEGCAWKEAPTTEFESLAAPLPSSKLAYLLEQVVFCISKESSRNYGTVGYFHKLNKNTLRLVGSDGYRLSYCDINVPLPDNFLTKGICLPKRALSEILRLCSEGSETITFAHTDTTLRASVGNCQIYMLLSGRKYPAYQSVLPTQLPKTARVSRTEFQTTARRVLLAADKTRALQLNFTGTELVLKSKTQGSTEGSENIPLKEYNGSNCKLAVHGKHLADIFSNMVGSDISISFKTEDQPIVFLSQEEPLGCQSKHILVPIREVE